MFRAWHGVLFALALLGFAAALAPASLFLRSGAGGLTFSSIEGSIWAPRLQDAAIGGLQTGDLRLTIRPAELLRGRLAVKVRFDGPGVLGAAVVERGGDVRLRADDLRIAAGALPGLAAAPIELALSDVDIALSRQSCEASGRVSSRADPSTALSSVQAPPLTGAVACVGPAARVSLSGQDGGRALDAWLDLRGDGSGSWLVAVTAPDAKAAALLQAQGMTPDGRGGFQKGGALRWLVF